MTEAKCERFRTHVTTDKPIYKPGETVRIRAFTINALNQTSVITVLEDAGIDLSPMVTIKSPKGDKVADIRTSVDVSTEYVCKVDWLIPEEISGGDFVVIVSFPVSVGDSIHLAPGTREFNIRTITPKRLKTQLEFEKKGYGADDKAVANLEVSRSEGGIPVGAAVEAIARIDGSEVYRGDYTVPESGTVVVSFQLPHVIEAGDGTLICSITDGGVVETASKTIPILLCSIDIHMYPEGGDLVAGLECGLYIEAFTPVGDPADIDANIEDDEGNVVGSISTVHEGRGKTVFTPYNGKSYVLNVVRPSGITKNNPLPPVKAQGVSLILNEPVAVHEGKIEVSVAATNPGFYNVTLSKLDTVLATVPVQISEANECKSVVLEPSHLIMPPMKALKGNPLPGKAANAGIFSKMVALFESKSQTEPVTVEAKPSTEGAKTKAPEGTMTVTVTEGESMPWAERCVFLPPKARIVVDVEMDKPSYSPGDLVHLKIKTTNSANGEPVSAIVGATVTDDSTLEMVETRLQPPRLPAMVLLEDEVNEFNDALKYLVYSEEEKCMLDSEASERIDLLLGTQGWRRFHTLQKDKIEEFLKEYSDKAKRVLVHHIGKKVVRPQYPRFRGGGGGMALRGMQQKGGMMPPQMKGMARMDGLLLGGAMPPPPGAAMPPPAPGAALPVMNIAEKVQAPPAAPPKKAAAPPRPPKPVANARFAIAKPQEKAMKKMKGKKRGGRAMAKRDVMEKEKKEEFFDDEEDSEEDTNQQYAIGVEYSHKLKDSWKPTDRSDFVDTVLHCTSLTTNEEGVTEFSFNLNDSVTSFKVLIDACSSCAANVGAIGSASTVFNSRQPFYVETKLPPETSGGDVVSMPVALVNSMELVLTGSITADIGETKALSLDKSVAEKIPISLGMNGRERKLIAMNIHDVPGGEDPVQVPVSVSAVCNKGDFEDTVTRKTKVAPHGFPYQYHFGGNIAQGDTKTHQFTIPDTYVPNSLSSSIKVYVAPVATLTSALKQLIREPYGCFEQTSSTAYPLIMAQQYFKTHSGVDPSFIERSAKQLKAAYKRLAGYQVNKGGFEWFGSSPAHEALTAYGVCEFTDMQKVMKIDEKVLKGAREWLLSRRDEMGTFKRDPKALDSFGSAPPDTTNGYIVYSLVDAGVPCDLEVENLVKKCKENNAKCSYLDALAAATLYKLERFEEATELSSRLVVKQKHNGSVSDSIATITRSGDSGRIVETTALAVLAWMYEYEDFTGNVESAIKYLLSCCRNGCFGSTQATVLALKAILKFDEKKKMPDDLEKIKFNVIVNGEVVDTVEVGSKDLPNDSPLILPDIASMLSLPGDYEIGIEMPVGFEVPYSVAVEYNATVGDTSDKCVINLETTLNDGIITEGEGTEIAVNLENSSSEGQPMTVAIIGIPAGLSPRIKQLKELVKANKVDFYETRGREVILYWRCLEPNAQKMFKIDVEAVVPGVYTAPASRAYLYYTDEYKVWCDPMSCKVKAK